MSAKIETFGHLGREQRVMLTTTPTSRPATTAPEQRAHAADDRDDEGFREHRKPISGIDAAHGRREHTRRAPAMPVPRPKTSSQTLRDIDAKHADDLGIARAGPDDEAEAGPLQEQPQARAGRRGHADDEQPVEREVAEAEVDRALTVRRRVERNAVVPNRMRTASTST